MTGSVFSTDGTGEPGPYSQTPYKLTTTDIESVGTGPSLDTSQTNDFTDPEKAFDNDATTSSISDNGFLYFILPSDNNTVEGTVQNRSNSECKLYIQNDTGYQNAKGTWNAGSTGWDTSDNLVTIPANSSKETITFTNNATDKTIARFLVSSGIVAIYKVTADGKDSGTILTFWQCNTNPDKVFQSR